MAGPVTAYNWVQGTTAAIVGPTRSRLRQVVIYADAAGAFTIKNGDASGDAYANISRGSSRYEHSG